MYIRWIARHHKNAETANVSFHDAYLVESYRDDSGQPRQRTICYLGNIRQIDGEFTALEREIFFIRAERILAGLGSIDAQERLTIGALLRQKIPDLSEQEVEIAFRNNMRWFRRWREQRGLAWDRAIIDDLMSEPHNDYEDM
jgi:hypothetical protein